MLSDRFIADSAIVRAELERRARAGQSITYGEAGHLVGRPAGGLGAILAAIRAEETERGRPDLTAIVVTMSTGLPSGIPRDRAIAVQEEVLAIWARSSDGEKT